MCYTNKAIECSRNMPIRMLHINPHYQNIPPPPCTIHKNERFYDVNSNLLLYGTKAVQHREAEKQDVVYNEHVYDDSRSFIELAKDGLSFKDKDVTISFWFHVPNVRTVKRKVMTALQGDIKIGGLLVISKSKRF